MRIQLRYFIFVLLVVVVLGGCGGENPANIEKGLGLPTALPESIDSAVEAVKEDAITAVPEDPAGLLPVQNVAAYISESGHSLGEMYGTFFQNSLFTRAADLEVVNIEDGTDPPERGFQYEALITVRNNGFVTTPEVKLDCDVEGEDGLGGWTWVASLVPGESRTVRTGFSGIDPGGYKYTCTVDSDNTLFEFNKTNNSKTVKIMVTMPDTDLLLVSVEDITASPKIGYEAEFMVTVENVGPERSIKVLVRCSYSPSLGVTEEQIVYAGAMENPGDTVKVVCGFNAIPAGTYVLHVELDYGDMLHERDETNNTEKLEFKVR